MGFGGLITKTCDSRALRRAGALVTEQAVTVAVTAKQAISALPADFLPNEHEAWAIIADALVNKAAVNSRVNSKFAVNQGVNRLHVNHAPARSFGGRRRCKTNPISGFSKPTP